ncbi:hypothetical protein E2C01_036070 [Portunus trituberculatus]|uniref:Uncharacterized protein n=1 Tax=Portunus trituberculatus TaxID=210409 RepID=A0A5B7FBG2_PORTR|nr:hypothetical protein [Portunus trituberculatus]
MGDAMAAHARDRSTRYQSVQQDTTLGFPYQVQRPDGEERYPSKKPHPAPDQVGSLGNVGSLVLPCVGEGHLHSLLTGGSSLREPLGSMWWKPQASEVRYSLHLSFVAHHQRCHISSMLQ